MACSKLMFLFEIVVDEIETLINYHDFRVFIHFPELFKLELKYPNNAVEILKLVRKESKRKSIRSNKVKPKKISCSIKRKVNVGQSVLIANNIESLVLNMTNQQLQIALCLRNGTEDIIGTTKIPWGQAYSDYLNNLIRNSDGPPVAVLGRYDITNELSSERIASIRMIIKLKCINNKVTTQPFLSKNDHEIFNHTDFNSNCAKLVTTVNELVQEKNFDKDYVNIKTTYFRGKQFKCCRECRIPIRLIQSDHQQTTCSTESDLNRSTDAVESPNSESYHNKNGINEKVVSAKSDTDMEISDEILARKSKSYSSVEHGRQLNTLNYIFGDNIGPYGNQVYCVGYCTVQKDSSNGSSSKEVVRDTNTSSSHKSTESKENYKFKICDSECPSQSHIRTTGVWSQSHCSVDLPADLAPHISVNKCDHVACNIKKHRQSPTPSDDRVLLDMSSIRKDCCVVGKEFKEKIETVVGGMKAKLKIGEKDPCYCSCECRFGFTKKTTYCETCGGYETVGEELSRRPAYDMPFPCPIFHKLVDKNKLKSYSGSDTKRRVDDTAKFLKEKKSPLLVIAGSGTEKDNKQIKKKKTDDRFKFQYGYKGIPPQIGHSQCAMPCSGTLSNVPRRMGWLWTAENIPGMKFRPHWKPGAAHKHVVRLLKIARNPGHVKAKKRRKETGKKRPLKRPLLTVHKKDGEYTVTMETMKAYSKQRSINQQPYEDKPVVTFTIGRSEEENRERCKKKERAHRRLERAQRKFIQSTFKDMCKDICVKTYQQALGILPGAEDPDCTCYPAVPGPDRTNLDLSCSCSEDSGSLGSTTDSDEWIVEFTPPNALFDPTYKGKKLFKVDNETQYTYLDYRVKMADRFGSPVPRFFIGPDGKQQCSDLGGFWSPEKKWLEINIDGFVAPDKRWAPNVFIGPNGEQVDAETGKFQTMNNKWLNVGVDGYVDSQGRWKYYPKARESPFRTPRKGEVNKKGEQKPVVKSSEATWSCFGDASPRQLGRMGIMGHGQDRKLLLATRQEMLARGEKVAMPQRSLVSMRPVSMKGRKPRHKSDSYGHRAFEESIKCKHPVPPAKGIVAMDAYGNKTYFRLKDYKNVRPKERLSNLTHQGISVSSFHLPCLDSFINSEILKQQVHERYRDPGKTFSTQAN